MSPRNPGDGPAPGAVADALIELLPAETAERVADYLTPSDVDAYGMPPEVEAELRASGVLRGSLPHAPATVSRRLSSWRRVAQTRGFESALTSSAVRRALSAATKASDRPKGRHSETAVTRQGARQADRRWGRGTEDLADPARAARPHAASDRLCHRWPASQRARALRIENVFPLHGEGTSFSSRLLSNAAASRVPAEGLGIALGRTKTTVAHDGELFVVTGRAQAYLDAWLAGLRQVRPDATTGPIFRQIDRWNNVGDRGLSGEAVNAILKRAADRAGLDPATVSAHGLRSGYLTEASLKGVRIEAAMRHSMHRSVQSAERYYRDQERQSGKAAKLAG